MTRNWIRRIIILLVFVASLIGFSVGMNKGNTDMTIEMPEATFPIAYITIDDQKINEMHGYAKRMDAATLRDTLTPIGEDRELSFQIDSYIKVPTKSSNRFVTGACGRTRTDTVLLPLDFESNASTDFTTGPIYTIMIIPL